MPNVIYSQQGVSRPSYLAQDRESQESTLKRTQAKHSVSPLQDIRLITHQQVFKTLLPFLFDYYWATRPVAGKDISYLRCRVSTDVHEQVRLRSTSQFQKIFPLIRSGQAHKLLKRDRGCIDPKNDAMGKCMYIFNELRDCACPPLSRKQYPQLRNDYENRVIKKALEIVKVEGQTTLNITFFGSGFLFTEFVLLIKLIASLEKQGWKGKLNIQFIDYSYTPVNLPRKELHAEIADLERQINKTTAVTTGVCGTLAVGGVVAICSNPKKKSYQIGGGVSLLAAIFGGVIGYAHIDTLESQLSPLKERRNNKEKAQVRKIEMYHKDRPKDMRASTAIPVLLSYLKIALPSEITIKARFFKDAEEYESLCRHHDKFKNDLLVGADFEGSSNVLEKWRLNTQTEHGEAVALRKDEVLSKTKIGKLDSYAILEETTSSGSPLTKIWEVEVSDS